MPPSMPRVLSWTSSSTFLTASFDAATIMSCSISTSPATSGSSFDFDKFSVSARHAERLDLASPVPLLDGFIRRGDDRVLQHLHLARHFRVDLHLQQVF